MAVDLSWDNLTNKLFPIRRVDRLVVWNATMRREAHELHGYELEEIDVAGPPQFDGYFNGELAVEPGRLLPARRPRPGAPPADADDDSGRGVPAPRRRHRSLLEAMRSGALVAPCDLLVRVHPRDDLRKYDRYRARRTSPSRSRSARRRARATATASTSRPRTRVISPTLCIIATL